jgi:hypothetical protein
MAEIRVIFGDDDRENEEFLGFDLDNIEEAEKRYIFIPVEIDLSVIPARLGISDFLTCPVGQP